MKLDQNITPSKTGIPPPPKSKPARYCAVSADTVSHFVTVGILIILSLLRIVRNYGEFSLHQAKPKAQTIKPEPKLSGNQSRLIGLIIGL